MMLSQGNAARYRQAIAKAIYHWDRADFSEELIIIKTEDLTSMIHEAQTLYEKDTRP